MLSLNILVVSAYAILAGAIPVTGPESSTTLETRACGSSVAPDALFLLDENRPDTYLPIGNNLFQVYQQQAGASGGRATGRKYLLVHFAPTPYNSNTCELHWNLPQDIQFLAYYGSHQLDIKLTTAYSPPFHPTWNSVIAGNPPTLGPGVFGTVNAVPGANAFVNSATCSNGPSPGNVGGGFGLAFVFKFADWVEQNGGAAGLSFYSGLFRGPTLKYSC